MSVAAVDHDHRVTPRELFFDLVFVFAFTQVAALLTADPTFAGIGRGALVLAALWWAWSAYAWLTNLVDPEESFVGVALLAALIAIFIAALAVPGVFGDEGVLFGAAFLVVCVMHLTLYALLGRGNRDLLGAVLRLAPTTLIGATLILVAGFADGTLQTWLWIAALVGTYAGAMLSGATGWQVFPAHFAERHGLVVIVALGEAFIAIGIGATGTGIGLGEVVAAILGLLIATAFWLAYFDFFSIRGEQRLMDTEGPERVAFARDVYTYSALPDDLGIVLFAFAMKTIVGHVGDELDARRGVCALRRERDLPADLDGDPDPRRTAVAVSRGRFVAAVVLLCCSRWRRRSRRSPRSRSSPSSGWRCTPTSCCGGARPARKPVRRSPRTSAGGAPQGRPATLGP